MGICPECKKYKSLRYRHPKKKVPICSACYLTEIGKVGLCTRCKEGPKMIPYRDPETNEPICHNCHAKIKRAEKGLPLRKNLYPTSESVIEALAVREKEGKQNYARVLHVENPSLYRKALKFGIPLPRRESFRKNPYPTRESVIEALRTRIREGKDNNAGVLISEDMSLYRKALKFGVWLPRAKFAAGKKARKEAAVVPSPAAVRTVEPDRVVSRRKENAKKPGRKGKYPDKEAVIAPLEGREAQGKENFPSVLQREDAALYHAALRFSVELPTKENPPIIYCSGDLVKNRKDPSLYGKIGEVLGANEKGARVDFKEQGKVIRVYLKWRNLGNITLHRRNPMMSLETAQKEVVPV
jgi:hypothetical protein